jgi:putative hydrolase
MKILCDCHFHTVNSGHAYSTLREYAEEAARKNLELIAITDHAPSMPGGAHLFHFQNLRILPQFLYGVEIFKGVEANIRGIDGSLDMSNEELNKLDFVIASLHGPTYKAGNREENTRAVVIAMKNPSVDIIGHPDDSRISLDLEEIARVAAETGTLLEVNNSSLLPTAFRENARENYLELLKHCVKYQTMIILNSDAHFHMDIGNACESLPLIESLNFPEHLVANTSSVKLKASMKKAE